MLTRRSKRRSREGLIPPHPGYHRTPIRSAHKQKFWTQTSIALEFFTLEMHGKVS